MKASPYSYGGRIFCRHDIHILYHKNTPHPNKPKKKKKNSAAVLSVQNLIWEGSVGQHVLSTEK